jgi:hypothetical protein
LELSDNNSLFYMRVEIFTGEYMTLTLIPSPRNNDWEFMPSIGSGTHNNMHDFDMFGIYSFFLGDGSDCHALLVTFDHKGVRIREGHESMHSGDLIIKEIPDKPEFALTHGDSA